MVCCWAMRLAVAGITIWRPELATTGCPAWLDTAAGAGLYFGMAALISSCRYEER